MTARPLPPGRICPDPGVHTATASAYDVHDDIYTPGEDYRPAPASDPTTAREEAICECRHPGSKHVGTTVQPLGHCVACRCERFMPEDRSGDLSSYCIDGWHAQCGSCDCDCHGPAAPAVPQVDDELRANARRLEWFTTADLESEIHRRRALGGDRA